MCKNNNVHEIFQVLIHLIKGTGKIHIIKKKKAVNMMIMIIRFFIGYLSQFVLKFCLHIIYHNRWPKLFYSLFFFSFTA